MDSHIITEILGEWAMRSSDGLASGHLTTENILLLKAILQERGLSEAEASCVASDVLNEDPAAAPVETDKTFEEIDRVLKDLLTKKKVRREFVDKFRPILQQHPELIQIYDQVSDLAKALVVCNTGIWNGTNYSAAFVEIDTKITHKGLGRGELILVFIIKGCVSGGSKAGDLVLSDHGTVDVKELDASREIFVMLNAIDGYQNLDFVKAFQELKTFLESEPEAEQILLQAYESEKKTSPVPDEMLQEDADELNEVKEDVVTSFIKNRNVSELGASVFVGMETIRKGLDKVSGSQVTPDTVTFNIGKEKKILLISDMEKHDVLQTVSRLSDKFDKITFHAASFKDRNSQYLVPILKSLKLFAGGANAITIESIHKELIKALHYDGIVFVEHGSIGMTYVPKSEMEDYDKSPMKFSRLSKGVKFKVSKL